MSDNKNDSNLSLEELDKRISNKYKELNDVQPALNNSINGGRFAIELAAAVGVGGFMGYYLDMWMDTKPIFFIVFIFLGVAAGILNIYKLSVEPQVKDSPAKNKTDIVF